MGAAFPTMVEYTSVASLLVVNTPPPVLLAVFSVIVELVTVAVWSLQMPPPDVAELLLIVDDSTVTNTPAMPPPVLPWLSWIRESTTTTSPVKASTAAPPVLPVTVEPSTRTSAGPPAPAAMAPSPPPVSVAAVTTRFSLLVVITASPAQVWRMVEPLALIVSSRFAALSYASAPPPRHVRSMVRPGWMSITGAVASVFACAIAHRSEFGVNTSSAVFVTVNVVAGAEAGAAATSPITTTGSKRMRVMTALTSKRPRAYASPAEITGPGTGRTPWCLP